MLQFISESLAAVISPDDTRFFFSHLMADHCHHHHRSRTSEVRDGTSWAQDNPVPPMYGAQDYDAYGHRIHRGNAEVFAEQFA